MAWPKWGGEGQKGVWLSPNRREGGLASPDLEERTEQPGHIGEVEHSLALMGGAGIEVLGIWQGGGWLC